MPSVRLNTQHVLLTYPQSRLDKTLLADYLYTLPNVKALIVGEENHQDGGKHFHVYLRFEKRV